MQRQVAEHSQGTLPDAKAPASAAAIRHPHRTPTIDPLREDRARCRCDGRRVAAAAQQCLGGHIPPGPAAAKQREKAG